MDCFHPVLKGQFWDPFQLLPDPHLLEVFLPNLYTFQVCVFIHLCLLSFAFGTVMVHKCASWIALLGLHNLFFPSRPKITPRGLLVCSNHLATDTPNPSSYLSVLFCILCWLLMILNALETSLYSLFVQYLALWALGSLLSSYGIQQDWHDNHEEEDWVMWKLVWHIDVIS